MSAKFKCLQCKAEWEGAPSTALRGCIHCGHLYVSWVNFESWRKQPGKSPKYLKAYPRL